MYLDVFQIWCCRIIPLSYMLIFTVTSSLFRACIPKCSNMNIFHKEFYPNNLFDFEVIKGALHFSLIRRYSRY